MFGDTEESTNQPTNTISTLSDDLFSDNQNLPPTDFPLVNMEDIPISNEFLVQNQISIDNSIPIESRNSIVLDQNNVSSIQVHEIQQAMHIESGVDYQTEVIMTDTTDNIVDEQMQANDEPPPKLIHADPEQAILISDPTIISDQQSSEVQIDSVTISSQQPSTLMHIDPSPIPDQQQPTMIQINPTSIPEEPTATLLQMNPSPVSDQATATLIQMNPSPIPEQPSTIIQMNPASITDQPTTTIMQIAPTSVADQPTTTIMQINPASISEQQHSSVLQISPQLIEDKSSNMMTTKLINTSIGQQVQFSPIKINVSATQPVFVNQVVGGSMQNSLANISYILPSSNINKQAIVNKASPSISMVSPNIVANLNPSTNPTGTVINQTASIVGSGFSKCNQNLKLIQTSQGQQLVLSPIKATSISKSSTPTSSQVSIKPSTSAIIVNQNNVDLNKTVMASNIVSSNISQPTQQQLIILSPVKANTKMSTASKSIMPSFKILPSTKLPNIAPSPSKRIIAPAPANNSSNQNKPIAIGSIGGGKPIQTIVHPNNKNVHYISFVPVSTTNQVSNTKILPSTKIVPFKPMVNTTQSNVLQVGQKVIINPSTIKISSTVPSSINVTTNPISVTQTSGQSKRATPSSIWMFPKQQILKLNDNTTTTAKPNSGTKSSAKFIPIAPNPNQTNSFHEVKKLTVTTNNANKTSNSSGDNFEEARRKACNCTRSQCLKLYCDCFANGEFCNNCNCLSCCNNLEHEEIRQKAIRLCLERNPNAFHPKIGQTQTGDVERRHTKGCCCKRSGCLKNYCECYEAKILCSDKCKCVGCKNFEESTERKTLMHLADAAEVRSAQQTVATKMHIWGSDMKAKLPVKVKSDSHPFNIFTSDVLESTASCLLAQAEEGEFENYDEMNVENLILEQFGECLSQMLNLSSNGIADDSVYGSEDDEKDNGD